MLHVYTICTWNAFLDDNILCLLLLLHVYHILDLSQLFHCRFSSHDLHRNSLESLKTDKVHNMMKYDHYDESPAGDLHPVTSFDSMLQCLYEAFSHDDVNIDYVRMVMESYQSDSNDWGKYAKFDPYR